MCERLHGLLGRSRKREGAMAEVEAVGSLVDSEARAAVVWEVDVGGTP